MSGLTSVAAGCLLRLVFQTFSQLVLKLGRPVSILSQQSEVLGEFWALTCNRPISRVQVSECWQRIGVASTNQ